MTDQQTRDRVTALAGVFQAAALVDDLARQGQAPQRAFEASVRSLFALDAPAIGDIFPADEGLATGRDFLRALLRRDGDAATGNRASYVMAMLHLNGLLRDNPGMQAVIRTRLGQIRDGLAAPDQATADDTVSKVAALYVDTFGTLRFRVQVRGEPRHLQDAATAARIRASLFAGVRAAHLWHHLGGRRWHLLFGTRRMLDALG